MRNLLKKYRENRNMLLTLTCVLALVSSSFVGSAMAKESDAVTGTVSGQVKYAKWFDGDGGNPLKMEFVHTPGDNLKDTAEIKIYPESVEKTSYVLGPGAKGYFKVDYSGVQVPCKAEVNIDLCGNDDWYWYGGSDQTFDYKDVLKWKISYYKNGEIQASDSDLTFEQPYAGCAWILKSNKMLSKNYNPGENFDEVRIEYEWDSEDRDILEKPRQDSYDYVDYATVKLTYTVTQINNDEN